MDNPRLEAFVPELKPRLAQIYERKKMSLHSTSLRGGSLLMGDSSASCQSVRFQSETDNRANFPSAQSFQYFRKQRDLFYEILRDSEQEERTGKTPDTKKKIKLKVDNLLASSSPHPVNLIHLARLFQSQLIQTCSSYLMNGYLPEESALADTLDEMQELKLIDPLKYNRLQTRFTTPSMFGGPCPKPDFSGPQEFFRDFIANCNNHQFMEHLKVSLAGNIMELNASSSFSPWDKADPRSLCLLEEEVMESVTSLRILGSTWGT
ncbi:Codanin 1 [Caligus rogercresseyi]|uniref:Codanin 1 n=1 Tax=Caligus rogercresseyi TaxID=217165 RepID=A0A7T8H2E2_CALRO|nr:Codanin 1 [Caligus rogercresseyi]